MFNFGGIELKDVRLGSAQPKSVYFGDVLIWSEGTPPEALFALKFTIGSNGSGFLISPVGSPAAVPTLEYSTDRGTTWDEYTVGTSVTGNAGDVIYLRASDLNNTFSPSDSSYFQLVTTGDVKLEGKLLSLKDPDGEDGSLAAWFFDKFLGDKTNSSHLTVDLDLSGITSLGQGALSGFANGVQFASGSRIGGFDQISSVASGGMLSAFAGSNAGSDVVDMTGLKQVQPLALNSAFRENPNVKKAILFAPDAETKATYGVDQNEALANMFSNSGIEELSILGSYIGDTAADKTITLGYIARNVPNLKNVTVSIGKLGCFEFRYGFNNCPSLSSTEITNLSSTYGADHLFWFGFNGCSALQFVNFPELTEILPPGRGPRREVVFGCMFDGCSSLSSVNFPKVNSVAQNAFKSSFLGDWGKGLLYGVPNVKELHFGPDAEATLTASRGWVTMWDAPNPDQISVWCGDVMIKPHVEPPRPEGFHFLEWAGNTANEVSGWIDTGLTIDQDTSVSAAIYGDCGGYMFFGTMGVDDQHDWRFFNAQTYTSMNCNAFMDCNAGRTQQTSGWKSTASWAEVSAWNNGLSVAMEGQTPVYKTGTTQGAFALPNTFKLAGNDMDGSDFKMPAQVRFKGVNVYSAGNLVMSLVPARQDMNTGMYDTISQQMFYPTNGTWIMGPDAT